MLPDVHGIKRIKAPDLQAPPPKEDVCRCMLGLEINMCFISIRKEIMSNTSRTCCCMPLSLLCPCFLYCQVFCGFGAALSWKDMRLLSLLVLPGPHVCCLGPLFFFFLKLSAYSFHFSALPGHEEDVCLHCFFFGTSSLENHRESCTAAGLLPSLCGKINVCLGWKATCVRLSATRCASSFRSLEENV
jgi:hypothetical protein